MRVTDSDIEKAQDRCVQGAVAAKLRDEEVLCTSADGGDDEVVPYDGDEIENETQRLQHLRGSAKHGDPERAFVLASTREFLEGIAAR